MPHRLNILSPEPIAVAVDQPIDWLLGKVFLLNISSSKTLIFSNNFDGSRIKLIIKNINPSSSCIITWPSDVKDANSTFTLPAEGTVEFSLTKISNHVYITQEALYYEKIYTVSGTYTITPPANVDKLRIICNPSGGGGGGGGYSSTTLTPYKTMGGGGGSWKIPLSYTVSISSSPLTLTVGAGGIGGTAQTSTTSATRGQNGGYSIITQNSQALIPSIQGGTGGNPGIGTSGGTAGQSPGDIIGLNGTLGNPGQGGIGTIDTTINGNILNDPSYNPYRGGKGGNGSSYSNSILTMGTSGENGASAIVKLIFFKEL